MRTHKSRKLLLELQDLSGQLRRRQADAQFERAGGAVLYAIDNDVLTTVTAPWDTRHQLYLRQLVAGDFEAQESLAYILAEFMFRSQQGPSPRLPFIILSPGDAELEGVWNRVYRTAQHEDVLLDEGLLQVIGLAKGFTARTPEMLYRLVRQLLECLQHRKGAIAQLHRIVKLQDSGSAVPASRVLLNGHALLPQPEEADREIVARLEWEWLIELNRRRPPKQAPPAQRRSGDRHAADRGKLPTNNDIDAAVMAQVEWINRQFASTQAGFNRRLCFLTGDRHIERIARARGVAEAFVRDPSCFFADEEFFQIAGVPTPDFLARPQEGSTEAPNSPGAAQSPLRSGNSLTEWLRLILPDPHTNVMGPDDSIRERVSKEIIRASDEWSKYLKSAAAGAGFREADADFQEKVVRVATTLNLADATEVGATLERLGKQAHEIGNEAMTRFGVSGVMASFLTLSQDNRWPSRNIPPVRMISWPQAAKVIEELMQEESLQSAQYHLIKSRLPVLREEDGTGYTVFIIYALAFAFAGEWESAYRVSKAAWSISSHYIENENSASMVRGVEAAYLCAVFSRYCASRPNALDECKGWLDAARARADGHRDAAQDIRFDVEELAIRVSGVNFAAFMAGEDGLLGPLLEFWSIGYLCQRHLTLIEMAAKDRLAQVANVLQQQLATNFLQLQLLAKLQGADRELLPAETKAMLRVLEAVADLGQGQVASRNARRPAAALTRFVYICASAMFDPSAAGWDTQSNRQVLFDDLKNFGKKLRAMPYDASRVERLIDMVARSM